MITLKVEKVVSAAAPPFANPFIVRAVESDTVFPMQVTEIATGLRFSGMDLMQLVVEKCHDEEGAPSVVPLKALLSEDGELTIAMTTFSGDCVGVEVGQPIARVGIFDIHYSNVRFMVFGDGGRGRMVTGEARKARPGDVK